MSVVALLTGVFHVSRRQAGALLADLVGLRISLGGISAIEKRVSEAVKPAVQEACLQVDKGEVKHADGTSWMKSGKSMALWTIATADATVFKIVANGSRATLESLFDDRSGILVSDRAKALGFWSIQQRQICWAHLLRRFVSFSERDGPGGELGRELLNLTGIMFEYWHDLKEGRMDRERFRRLMAPVQRHLEAQLYQGVAAEITGVSGSCADILAHREALWTFVSRSDVEPTNNHAERELRRFVLWRKRSFGTQSERGNRFAEALMTLAHTAKKQGLDLLAFLTACCRANRHGEAPPSLVAPADAGLVS
jgi:transposase